MLSLKKIRQLQQKKYRYEYRQFLVEGVKGVQEALAAKRVRLLMIEESKQQLLHTLIMDAAQQGIEIRIVSAKDAESVKTTETFAGVLAVCDMTSASLADVAGTVICLDTLQDPGNVGTIIRTADWFGVSHILLSENCVDPYNEKTVRSSMGSLFHVQLYQSTNIIQDVGYLQKQHGYQVHGLTLHGRPLSPDIVFSVRDCLVFGSESHGLSSDLEKMLHARYTIPGIGQAESLNVAIAAGIVLSRVSL